jgi:hypothetical protein
MAGPRTPYGPPFTASAQSHRNPLWFKCTWLEHRLPPPTPFVLP